MTKPFVPRGNVLVSDIVQRILREVEVELIERVRREKESFQALKNKWQQSRRLRHLIALRSPPPAGGAQEGVQRDLFQFQTKLWQITQAITEAIRQDLGEGDVEAIAVTPWGAIFHVPPEAWRTESGAAAMSGEELIWWEPGLLTQHRGIPMVSEEDVAHWLDRFSEAKRKSGALIRVTTLVVDGKVVQTETAEVGSPRSGEDANAMESGQPVKPRPTARSRSTVDQGKADQWMLAAATAAKASDEIFGRLLGVAQCQAALNCTRAVAAAAYKALPDALKRPRGKPPGAKT